LVNAQRYTEPTWVHTNIQPDTAVAGAYRYDIGLAAGFACPTVSIVTEFSPPVRVSSGCQPRRRRSRSAGDTCSS
jgi:hypothetical protein